MSGPAILAASVHRLVLESWLAGWLVTQNTTLMGAVVVVVVVKKGTVC